MRIGFIVCSFISLVACNPKSDTGAPVHNYAVNHATGFSVLKYDNYTKVTIRNPWDTLQNLQQYILVRKGDKLPSPLPQGTVVRIPLESVIAYGALQCSILEELKVTETLKGVCESKYIDLPFVKRGIESGLIPDVGEAMAPDVEKIIELEPEAILTSPFQNMSYGRVSKTGIPLIECADYMERTPLGRAEWIRFHGLFYDKEALADSIFNETCKRYQELTALAATTEERPSVISEQKTGPTWYVPGGKSYMSNIFKDAGARYIWENDNSPGSLALSFEEVFDKGVDADFWLIKFNSATPLDYTQLKNNFPLNARFKAWREKNIYTCNTGEVAYYEETPFHPDRLLVDMIAVFHPELLPAYQRVYFKPMEGN